MRKAREDPRNINQFINDYNITVKDDEITSVIEIVSGEYIIKVSKGLNMPYVTYDYNNCLYYLFYYSPLNNSNLYGMLITSNTFNTNTIPLIIIKQLLDKFIDEIVKIHKNKNVIVYTLSNSIATKITKMKLNLYNKKITEFYVIEPFEDVNILPL